MTHWLFYSALMHSYDLLHCHWLHPKTQTVRTCYNVKNYN